MKTLQKVVIFLFCGLLLVNSTHPMKREALSGLEQSKIKVSRIENTTLQTVCIITNYNTKDNCAMRNNLKVSCDALFFKNPQKRPILMVSPSVIKDLTNDLQDPGLNFNYKNNLAKHSSTNDDYDRWPSTLKNYISEIFKRSIILNNPQSHYVIIFPNIYKTHLNSHTIISFNRDEEDFLSFLDHKEKIQPNKNDFEYCVQLCKVMDNITFKVCVMGHGNVGATEEENEICNFSPTDCSEMLSTFDKTNIKLIAIASCCSGDANAYFLTREKLPTGEWQKVTRSFHLIVQGIDDHPRRCLKFVSFFLSHDIPLSSTAANIISILSEKNCLCSNKGMLSLYEKYRCEKFYKFSQEEATPYSDKCIGAGACSDRVLQIVPSETESFVIYPFDYLCIIDTATNNTTPFQATGVHLLILINDVHSIINIPRKSLLIYLKKEDCLLYTFDEINLENWGIIDFIEHAFMFTGSIARPKKVFIKKLSGLNDLPDKFNNLPEDFINKNSKGTPTTVYSVELETVRRSLSLLIGTKYGNASKPSFTFTLSIDNPESDSDL